MVEHPPVEESPDINGGYPVVWGTRTPVRVIVGIFRQTGDFEHTAAMVPHLSHEQVRAALDYYAAQPERVDEDIDWNARALAELQGRPWPA